MKRALILAAVLLFAVGGAALATSWVVTTPVLQDGDWTTIAGAGLGGADAYQGVGWHGQRRGVWKFEGDAYADMPTTATLMNIYVYAPTGGLHGWQPVQVIINGAAGDTYPYEPNIPWGGQWGTNAQWQGSDWNVAGTWMKAGPGPQAPGDMVYVKKGCWLFVKWDFGWPISNTISAVKLDDGVIPEPSSFLALLAGFPAIALLRRKR